MKKDSVFFDGEGLTSTSANHVANMAKEWYQMLEREVKDIHLEEQSVGLLSEESSRVLQHGVDKKTMEEIPSKVRLIAEAKSLIAWLREAIKAREAMLKEVKEKTMETFCEEHEEYTMPKRVDAKDVKYKSLTIDDVVGEMSVKERNRYYELEAYCAEIGKYIHPDGAFARMREEYMDHLRHPHEAKGTGRDMLIYTYSPTVAKEDVERVFFEMQREYRELQSELNGMKHRIESAVSADELKKRALLNKDNESYRSEIEQLTGALEAWRLEEGKRVSDMKIVIPKSLENVYRKISDLSKQKTKSDKKKDK